jgi:hypothetical protein
VRAVRMNAELVAFVLLLTLCACTGTDPAPAAGPPTSAGIAATATTTPAAAPAGTPGWQLTHPGPEHAIEGFTDRVSVAAGDPVRLFVSTTAARYTVAAFRIGAYQDSDATAVWTSPPQPGTHQPPAVVQEPTHTVVAPWKPSSTIDTTGGRRVTTCCAWTPTPALSSTSQ